MTTAEEKLDLLVTEVKSLQAGQLKLLTTVDSLNKWSITADAITTDLGTTMKDLMSRIEALEAATSPASPHAPPCEEEGRAHGHRVVTQYQGNDGRNSSLHHALVKGEHQPHLVSRTLDFPESSHRRDSDHFSHNRDYKLPKLDFPKFDGSHPRVWKEKCEKYFSMYHVPSHLWASFATLHFKGNAELWLQTYEAQHDIESWVELTVAVDTKFSRDLYQNYMRDFMSLKQTGDLQNYYDRFNQAMHRILVHNGKYDDIFFVIRFIDGLKLDIKSAI